MERIEEMDHIEDLPSSEEDNLGDCIDIDGDSDSDSVLWSFTRSQSVQTRALYFPCPCKINVAQFE
jgi:hypothetical protein